VAQSAELDAALAPIGARAIEALAPRAGERILDVGCGAGATTRLISEAVGESGAVLGLDVSEPLVEAARARGGRARYLCGDAGSLTVPDAPWDALFSRFGVMFFDDPTAAFAHLRGALRSGGRLAFVCWRSAAENPWARAPLAAALPFVGEPPTPAAPGAPGPFAFADDARLRGILEGAGFREVAIEAYDPAYRMGADPAHAADLATRIGPLGALLRERPHVDRAPVRAAVQALFEGHVGPQGVTLPGACWVVRARA
jgi:ubiquinone/menaquinone biosynthesis C-methylase UbiE